MTGRLMTLAKGSGCSLKARAIAVALSALVAPFLVAAAETNVPKVVRGPYLQLGRPDSMVIRWRTDQPTSSEVKFGTVANKLDRAVTIKGKSTEHVIQLSSLTSSTTYHYSVWGDDKVQAGGGGKPFSFTTSPIAGTRGKVRIWALGDSGTANTNAAAVRDAYERYAGTGRTDVMLMLGDNAYPDGTDAEYQKAIFQMYTNTLPKVVLWPTLGNHDARSASSSTQSGPYYDNFTLPTLAQAGGLASGTEAYYSFDYANIHFVCLDSEDSGRAVSGAMLTWLKRDLASTRQDWMIAYFHHPPYTKGSHDSDNVRDSGGRMRDMRETVLPILEQAGVDLVLTGHSHSYERSFLVDGHYGKSKTLEGRMIKDRGDGREDGEGVYRKQGPGLKGHQGTVYTVAGSSGQTSGGKLNHPVMFLSLNVLGSLVLDVEAGQLTSRFLDDRGETRDWYTMRKVLRR